MTERRPGDGRTDEPVACTIDAETKAQREADIATDLAPHVRTVERCEPDGWRLEVEEAAIEGLTRFVRREHDCCSFAHFHVHVTPGGESNVLEITGPEGTDELFREGFVEPLVEEFGVEQST